MSQEETPSCRVCKDDIIIGDKDVLSPCNCTGSMAYVHTHCLANWIISKGGIAFSNKCETCDSYYEISESLRKNKLTWFDTHIMYHITYLYANQIYICRYIPIIIACLYYALQVSISPQYSLLYLILIYNCIDHKNSGLSPCLYMPINLIRTNTRMHVLFVVINDVCMNIISMSYLWLFYRFSFFAFCNAINFEFAYTYFAANLFVSIVYIISKYVAYDPFRPHFGSIRQRPINLDYNIIDRFVEKTYTIEEFANDYSTIANDLCMCPGGNRLMPDIHPMVIRAGDL